VSRSSTVRRGKGNKGAATVAYRRENGSARGSDKWLTSPFYNCVARGGQTQSVGPTGTQVQVDTTAGTNGRCHTRF
jgi:hypothetical protein